MKSLLCIRQRGQGRRGGGREKKRRRKNRTKRDGEAAAFLLLPLPLFPSHSLFSTSSQQTKKFIDAEHRFGAHNYAPLPVVLERGVRRASDF